MCYHFRKSPAIESAVKGVTPAAVIVAWAWWGPAVIAFLKLRVVSAVAVTLWLTSELFTVVYQLMWIYI